MNGESGLGAAHRPAVFVPDFAAPSMSINHPLRTLLMRSTHLASALILFAVGGMSLAAWAESGEPAQPTQPLWELGGFGFGVSQQAYPGSSEQVNRVVVLPFFVYRGEVLRAERGTAGIRALKTERFELDVGVSGSFGSNSNDIDARRGMPNLGTLVEFGPRLRWNLGPGPGGGRWRVELPLRGVFDLSDSLSARGVAFEPELAFERRGKGGLSYSAGLGALVGNTRLNEHFYGVAPQYASAARPAYSAQSGLIAWRVSTGFIKPLNRDWRLFGFARIDTVSGAANARSPLVDRQAGGSIGFGLSYTWMRSQRQAAD